MNAIRKNLKYLFPAVILIMLLGLLLSRVYRPERGIPEAEIRIHASEAINHIGKAAEVCGKVAKARFIPQIDGQPTFINFGQPNPNQDFTAIIWGENRGKWIQNPEDMYPGEELCVVGLIEEHEGIPQIEVRHPKQIQIDEE